MFRKFTRTFLLLFLVLPFLSMTGDKPAYQIYNGKGRQEDYRALLKAASRANIILFGELHKNPIAHWLEFELTRDLYAELGNNLVLGAEMFEVDNQLLLNEYTSKMIRKKDFEAEAKLWPNYKTDYASLVDFAREKGLRFVATNIPRRYAALVNTKGFEGLDSINAMERGLIAPLPIKYPDTLACYADIVKSAGNDMPAHLTANLGKAQAIKDATMAHFLTKNGAFDGKTVLHFNGSYHSENRQGIVWYVNQAIRKTSLDLKVLTIACIEQENIDTLSAKDAAKADFIIVIPSSMPGSEGK
ncbi:MAG TPA: ChaN family lipoprotein [Bacteroidales bacterium]|nr:ChaN family lipoprotein [Bacteroidales bacterium]HPS62340.1 ChaN family lipoprotein [Bacteroidales bacterium]